MRCKDLVRIPASLVFAALWIPRCAAAQTVVEFPLPSGSAPSGIALGADGNIWFAEESAARIGRVTASGEISERPLPDPGSRPHGIMAGANRSILFTERAGRIGILAADGTLQERDVPGLADPPGSAVPAEPLEISAGFLNLVWFSDPANDAVQSRSADLAIPTFTVILAKGARPTALVQSLDGDLWIAESGIGRIARVRFQRPAAGVPGLGTLITSEIPLPDPASEPRGICARADGIWFTERAASKIGHIHVDGRLEEFPLPAGAAPSGITPGRDGALWFTETGTDRIGRITTAGALAEIALTPGSIPSSIVSGADGNVWFTETGRDRIGRVTVEVPCVSNGQTLCLNLGRFRVLASWGVPAQGASGQANAIPLTEDTGAFWFFTANNVELAVKVVDGRAVNGHFWVFGAGLSDVDYTLFVTDTSTGAVWSRHNAPGQLASFADTTSF